MKIRMYNVGYGDCFCLRDRKGSLLVDFGTSNSRIEGRPRKETFDVIISDLTTIEKKNLLLTHFHLDHLSGLLYMMKHRSSAYEFGKIYLPDVFGQECMDHTLVLLLLADLVKDSCLPSRQVSLFALVEALCQKPQKVELLSRGSVFEGKYQALWPDKDVIYQETENIYNVLQTEHRASLEKLNVFAERLRRIVYSMTKDNQEWTDLPVLAVLEREFRQMRTGAEFSELLAWVQSQNLGLRSFKNMISIVFQNARDGELNLLFTGDVKQQHMKMIADNYDGKLPLFEHYWCIKVPHHGTQEYYYDFSEYAPENMLISNGIHYSNSKKQSKELRTSSQYGGLFYISDAHMYCSNCDSCDGYENGCTCKESDIISPAYYKYI